jgi:hypothetical protein
MVLCEAEIEDEKGNYTVQSTLVRLPCSLELLIRHRTVFFFHNKNSISQLINKKNISYAPLLDDRVSHTYNAHKCIYHRQGTSYLTAHLATWGTHQRSTFHNFVHVSNEVPCRHP